MTVRPLTTGERLWFLVACALYAAVVIPIGIHRGGDFVQELGQSERLIRGLPLYATNPEKGVYWPPFALGALVPFALVARLSLTLAQALWAAFNVWCLGWSIAAIGRRWGWAPALLAVASVAKPLQGNFEHQNITVVLLALIVAATVDLHDGRPTRAGLWIGVATALKAFPGLLLVYLLARRQWRGAAAGAVAAGALTLGAMARYGPTGAVATAWRWLMVSRAAPIMQHFGTQPLGNTLAGVGLGTPAVIAIEIGIAVLIAVAVLAPRSEDPQWAPYEVGLVTMLAVLITPIGWFYYHTLCVPAWVAAITHRPAENRNVWWRATLITAAVLLSGMLTFDHLYPDALAVLKRFNYVWGALLLLAALLTLSLARFRHARD
ncbi:MAG TPA: glycosyltransferase family 87 protein [Gemmatimonadales bacterium]|nr:glycosyltransferase family 87 protein [Gemmatimonadales bacterium]